MRPALLDRLPPDVLRRAFSTGSMSRGRGYAAEGRVLDLDLDEEDQDFLRLEAVVLGSGYDYDTSVEVACERGRWSVESECSCPVVMQCKHGVAVLLTARGADRGTNPEAPALSLVHGSGDGPPRWAGLLDDVLSGLEDGTGETSPLALQVELGRPAPVYYVRPSSVPPTVLLRPLRRGSRAAWVKGGAGWNDVSGWVHRPELDPRQRDAITDLAELRGAEHLYVNPSSGVELDGLGPGVWPALRQAVGAGVELVGVGEVGQVEVAEGPASVRVDVTGGDDGHQLCAEVSVEGRDGARWSGESVLVLGSRGHGVALLDRAREGADGAPGSVRLLLARLDGPLDPGVRRLLTAPAPLSVPAEAGAELLGDYLPRLRRHLAVGSSDDSVDLPEDPPPTVQLSVDWRERGTIALSWHWRYSLGRSVELVPLQAPPGRSPLRDPEAEADLRDQLAGLDLGPGVDLLDDAPAPWPRARQDLRGDDLLAFVGDLLPRLRAESLVEVVDDGTPVDYRAADGDPVIRFPATGPSAPSDQPADPDAPTDWLDLAVVITVDSEEVALRDVLAALTRDEPAIVLASGLVVRADHPALLRLAEAVRSAAALRSDAADPDDGEVRIGACDLALWAELSELGVIDEQAAAWVESARALAGFDGLPEVEPAGVVSDLRSYQLDGFRWLAFLRSCGLGGILADDMGLGKTVQALAAIGTARAEGAGPVLVVAPTSVVGNWLHEATRHTPGLVVRSITATRRRRGTRIVEEVDGVDVLVTSYTLLRLEVEEYAGLAWGGLVLDEAQQAKNHRGKTYQAVRCLDASFRLALTGTPVENRLSELWSLLSIVAPGLYPDVAVFTEQVATPVEKRGDQDALARFRRRIRPFLLRRTKELVAADLPAKQEQVLDITLGGAHRKVYDARLQRERQAILGLLDDFENNKVAVFAALTRLRQLSLDAGLVDPDHAQIGSAKLDQLVAHLHEIAAEGHRALVFSQFTRFLRLAQERLTAEGISTVYLDGGTRDRADVVRRFREGDAPAFLISLKAGGVGLTLTEADYVFVLDPWWNPAVEAQAVDRTHRIGQTRPVMVYRLVATDTVEEKVMELKARKAALIESVLDGDAALAQTMTADDVRAMLEG